MYHVRIVQPPEMDAACADSSIMINRLKRVSSNVACTSSNTLISHVVELCDSVSFYLRCTVDALAARVRINVPHLETERTCASGTCPAKR